MIQDENPETANRHAHVACAGTPVLRKDPRRAAAASYKGHTAHVVINYRGKVNRTFAVPASVVLEYMQTQTRKRIPWQWAVLNGIEVEQHLLRVHWRYDVDGLLKRLEKENDNGMR